MFKTQEIRIPPIFYNFTLSQVARRVSEKYRKWMTALNSQTRVIYKTTAVCWIKHTSQRLLRPCALSLSPRHLASLCPLTEWDPKCQVFILNLHYCWCQTSIVPLRQILAQCSPWLQAWLFRLWQTTTYPLSWLETFNASQLFQWQNSFCQPVY